MRHDDDTKIPTGVMLASDGRHGIARLDDGRVGLVVEAEHARTCCPDLNERGVTVALRAPRRPARSGPPRVASEAYRDGYDRIFRRPVGDES